MIRTVLDISTIHMPSASPDWGNLTSDQVLEYDRGFVVFVLDPDGCPEWLRPIMRWADDKGCLMICFDGDGDPQEDIFPAYNW